MKYKWNIVCHATSLSVASLSVFWYIDLYLSFFFPFCPSDIFLSLSLSQFVCLSLTLRLTPDSLYQSLFLSFSLFCPSNIFLSLSPSQFVCLSLTLRLTTNSLYQSLFLAFSPFLVLLYLSPSMLVFVSDPQPPHSCKDNTESWSVSVRFLAPWTLITLHC